MSPPALADVPLATQFLPPQTPPAMIARPRLLERLDGGIEVPLTLLVAPAGTGKSALVSSWAAAGGPPGPVAWLSLDAHDADPRRFWGAVFETLARATGDARIAGVAANGLDPGRLRRLVATLGDQERPVTLVLDDFHEVADAVHGDVERLVRFAPPSLRLVVIARADPAIGLGRLRVDGRLNEIRSGDLAFTRAEAASMCAAMGVELAGDDLDRLWERTEGWAAALRLAASALRDHPDPGAFLDGFAGTDATIAAYLVSEVLAPQPPELRDFLLRTSIVDALDVGLAETLTGRTDGPATIGQLELGGVLATPIDEHGAWHRYHPLLAELLRAELRAQLPDEVEELHWSAAVWLAAHGRDADALRHAVAASEWDLVADLVAERWLHFVIEGEIDALRAALEAMPRERIEASPELSLAYGGALLARGDHVRAAPYVSSAREQADRVPVVRRAQLMAGMAVMGLYEGCVRGDPERALRAALELVERDPVLDREEVVAAVRGFAWCQLGIVELWTGDLDAAVEHLERGMSAAIAARQDWTALAARAHLAVAHTIRGDVSAAGRHARDAVDLADGGGWTRTEHAGAAYCVLAALAVEQARNDDCAALLEQASAALADARHKPLLALHGLVRSLLLTELGLADAALTVLHVARDQLGDWPLLPQLETQLVAQEALLRTAVGQGAAGRKLVEGAESADRSAAPVANALARLRLLDGDSEGARLVLAPHLAPRTGALAPAMPLPVRAETWLLEALALDALGEYDDAACALERTLELAGPAGLTRLIVAQGGAARALLRRHTRYGTAHPAVVAEVIEALEHRGAHADRPPVPLATPLSDREQAVLSYLPTMMSNREIANELFLSINTVKTHLKAIYRKLDAAGRREAVARGRALGLMP